MEPIIAVALIGAVAGIANTVLTLLQRNRINETHGQVKNAHTTNLREDIDRLAQMLRHIRGQMNAMRKELNREREERIGLEARVDEVIKRHLK